MDCVTSGGCVASTLIGQFLGELLLPFLPAVSSEDIHRDRVCNRPIDLPVDGELQAAC